MSDQPIPPAAHSPRPDPTQPVKTHPAETQFPKAGPRRLESAAAKTEAPAKGAAEKTRKRQRRLQPAPRTRRMIGIASALLVVGYGGFLGTRQRTGWGNWVDFLIGAGVAIGLVLLAPLVFWLIVSVVRLVPRTLGYLGFGAFLGFLVLLDWSGLSGLSLGVFDGDGWLALAATGVFLVALFVGCLAVLTSGEFGKRGTAKKIAIVGSGLVGLLLLVGAGLWTSDRLWLTGDAAVAHLVDVKRVLDAEVLPPSLNAPNPSHKGDHNVLALTYGSGEDTRRPEFHADAIALTTEPVNGKPFTSIPKGWKGDMRREFWGFDIDRLPVQGRVWYPDGDGPFPLVLVVHGNHNMAEFSDPGYEYLGQLMASRGFIITSVDENFLNGASGEFFAGARNENDARGWLLLEHLKVWRGWNQTEGNPFFGKVDMDNIGLVGHSRGGEAVQHAAVFNRLSHYPDDASVAFDFGFDIKGVVAIAPVDTQYRPGDHDAVMEDVSFFTIHGSHDADVTRFHGDRMFKRLRFTEPGDYFKSTLYVYRANHGQFNTVWGPTDTGAPRAWFLNQAALLDGDDQRRVAEVYISAFFEATLKGRSEYIAMFRDHRLIRPWLPGILLVNRFEDPSFRLITDYEEDVDVTTTTIDGGSLAADNLVVWREGDIKFRGGGNRDDHGAYLGWNVEEQDKAMAGVAEASLDTSPDSPGAAPRPEPPAATYTISLPAGLAQQWQLGPESLLVLNLTQSTDSPEPKDYSADTGDENEGSEQGDETADENAGAEEEDETKPDHDEPLDLTVELVTSRGVAARVKLSQFGTIPPPLESQVMRTSLIGSAGNPSSEPVLQTFEIPISAFIAAEPEFVPVDLAGINLVFDQGDKGVVIVDRIGFAQR